MTNLVLYDAACRAIVDAKAVDEVKHIRDIHMAMATYARQAKNHDMEADAVEIRMRATRRIDQLRQAQKESVGLNQGTAGAGRPSLGGLNGNPPKDDRPTLASQGIDKNLAHQARTLGAMTEEKFEKVVADAREVVSRTVRNVVDQDTKAERRAEREASWLGDTCRPPRHAYLPLCGRRPRSSCGGRRPSIAAAAEGWRSSSCARSQARCSEPSPTSCPRRSWATRCR